MASAPSVADIIARNGDPFTLALRSGEDLSHDQLLLLNEASSSSSTSVGSASTAVFSSHEPSIVTKPTSYGTYYPAHNYIGREKALVEYASSVSASHGSSSEVESDHDDARGTALLGTGAWSSGQPVHDQALRGSECSKLRLAKLLPNRCKKPSVVLHHSMVDQASSCPDGTVSSTAASTQAEEGTFPIQYRRIVSAL